MEWSQHMPCHPLARLLTYVTNDLLGGASPRSPYADQRTAATSAVEHRLSRYYLCWAGSHRMPSHWPQSGATDQQTTIENRFTIVHECIHDPEHGRYISNNDKYTGVGYFGEKITVIK